MYMGIRGKAKRLFNRYYGYEGSHSLLEISQITGYSMFHLERFYNHLIKYTYRTRTYKYAYAMGTIYTACVPFLYHHEKFNYYLRRTKPVRWGKNKR